MIVEQVMMSPVFTVEPETSVGRAWDMLQDWRCRHLPVVEAGELVGIVSDRDLRVALASAQASEGQATVGMIMHRGVVTVSPRASIEDAAQEMINHKIGSLPVVDDDHLIGIVTETDLLALLTRMLSLLEPSTRLEIELQAENAFGEGVLSAYRD